MKSSSVFPTLIFAIVPVAIASCSAKAKWPAEQKDAFIKTCTDSTVVSSAGRILENQAKGYCACTLGVIESRYPIEEMEKRPFAIMQDLIDDGSVKTCLTKAGVAVP